jgi:drug/metabolite transporter (DMT)-like permease
MAFDVYFWIICAAGLLCAAAGVVFFLRKEPPNDITLLGAGAVLLATLVYAAAGIIRPLVGDSARGNVPEFWAYMITQISIPVAGAWWALVERTRWSNLILAAVGLVGIVMAARMNQIWYAVGGMTP